jgi:hypothetical protein
MVKPQQSMGKIIIAHMIDVVTGDILKQASLFIL